MALDFTDGVVSQRTETRYKDLCQALGVGVALERCDSAEEVYNGTAIYEAGW